MMDDERLHLEQWDRLTSAERAAVAREVAERLPAPWRLLGMRMHRWGISGMRWRFRLAGGAVCAYSGRDGDARV